ncbi:MAG: hypothetical protein HYW49_04935 [Deltaproteobacteria bacterium]|nr:hypothetical protein [Deltaproteobacteria bacterium]
MKPKAENTSAPTASGTGTRRFTLAMRGFFLLYLAGGLVFLFLPDVVSRVLGLAPPLDRFWVALSVSMMAMLAYLSRESSRDPANAACVKAHLLSKGASVAGFLLAYLALDRPLAAYLVGAGVDLAILLSVWRLWRGV